MSTSPGTIRVLAPPYLQTLSRGIAVLEALTEAGEPVSGNELARRIGVHRTVAYRLLRTLEAHRLVTETADGRHALGLGLVSLASGVTSDLRSVAAPILAELAETTRATAFLSMADGDDVVTLLQVEPRHPGPRVTFGQGLRRPLGVGSPGTAILAGRPALPGEREAVTRARRAGYARSEGELEPGTVGFSAPLKAGERPANASVSVVFLSGHAFADADAAAAVRQAATAISAAGPVG